MTKDLHGMARFRGKVAVVTGAAGGMGSAISARLVAEGACVVGGDIDEPGLERVAGELGERFLPVRSDVTIEDDCADLVRTAVERFETLNLAFNVAGVPPVGTEVARQTETEWDRVVDVLLKGVFFGIKHQSARMIEQGQGGAIVVIGSTGAIVPAIGASGYNVGKAGAVVLAQNAAIELAEHGIRVNVVSPGLTDTPMSRGVLHEIPGIYEAYTERIPMRRQGFADEQAATALFLASDDASYITGANLFVDGGWVLSANPDLRPYLSAWYESAAQVTSSSRG